MNNDNGNKLILEVKKLSENAILPFKATELSAGYDLSRYIILNIKFIFKTINLNNIK
jgi:hypothetical protein